jgi:uncharacterized protein (TIGR02284 family)
MADAQRLTKKVVEVLNDGHKGFKEFGEHIKDARLKAHFFKESQTRGEYAQELERAAGLSSDVGGTASGTVHRA